VVENTAKFSSEFLAEHGFSILIEHENSKILFDTGRSPKVLEHNMEILDAFNNLDSVVISHGHNDHTGGISTILKNSSVDIYMHENGFKPKYLSQDGNMRFIGTVTEYQIGADKIDLVDDERSRLKFVGKTMEIAPDIYIFTDIPMKNNFEKIDPSLFSLSNGKFVSDKFHDEIVVVLRLDNGLVIVSGCAHKGIINTVTAVSEYFNEKVLAVVGGTHLVSADENRKNRTVDEFKMIQPEKLVFGHCTGFDVQHLFKYEFKEVFQPLECGTEIMF